VATTHGAQLYNLAKDIGEQTNLADKEPEKFKELAALGTNGTRAISAQVDAGRAQARAAAAGRIEQKQTSISHSD